MELEHFDALIIGAGISGIGAGFHLQSHCPELKYAILESRTRTGGTWDLFRYPGIRSDSDMYTLGYSFRPWRNENSIADGNSILQYIDETASQYGIDQKIKFSQKVLKCEWSEADSKWTLTVSKNNETIHYTCGFLIFCTGYYDQIEGYTPEFPGIKNYRGEFIHPQNWNKGIQYAGKNVVVIGSGATAVTLIPEMAKTAQHVTMLQRSPTYVVAMPTIDFIAEAIKNIFPPQAAHLLIRYKNILTTMVFYRFCKSLPGLAKKAILWHVRHQLKERKDLLKHFTPNYNPWDQRLCVVPDGDLFRTLRTGRTEIVTDTISTFTENGILLSSGRELKADMIVSATGLNMKFLGGIEVRVDGEKVEFKDRIPFKGTMLSGVPNLGMTFGYTNATWTLRCDLCCEWIAQLIRFMQDRGYRSVRPIRNPSVGKKPLLDFSPGYILRARGITPSQGDREPWKVHQNYFLDMFAFKVRPVEDRELEFK